MNTLPWLERRNEGLVLRVHVQPRARETAIAGRHAERLKIRLKSAPHDGAANAELIRFLATAFGVSQSQVELLAGHTSRTKTIRVRNPSCVPPWLPTLAD